MNVSKRGIFWTPVGDSAIPGYGNPAASLTVKFYLTAVKEEQLLARTVPIQAEPGRRSGRNLFWNLEAYYLDEFPPLLSFLFLQENRRF